MLSIQDYKQLINVFEKWTFSNFPNCPPLNIMHKFHNQCNLMTKVNALTSNSSLSLQIQMDWKPIKQPLGLPIQLTN